MFQLYWSILGLLWQDSQAVVETHHLGCYFTFYTGNSASGCGIISLLGIVFCICLCGVGVFILVFYFLSGFSEYDVYVFTGNVCKWQLDYWNVLGIGILQEKVFEVH